MRLVLSAIEEVIDGVAVGEHDTVISPFVAQDVDEQAVAGAAGLALEALVGAHHLAHIAFLHQCLEGRKIGLPEVAVGGFHIHRVAQGLGAAMNCVMLGAGMRFVEHLVACSCNTGGLLHAQHGLYAKHSIQKGVLAARLLSASPTWVTEDVHVRTPERQFRIARIVHLAHTHMLHAVVGAVPVGACFVADLREYIVDQLLAEGCRHSDGLRIDGVASLAHTVTGLAPPVIAGNAQAVDRYRLVHHQSHLLFSGQHTQQTLYSLRPRQLWVLPGVLGLSRHTVCAHDDGDSRHDNCFLHTVSV